MESKVKEASEKIINQLQSDMWCNCGENETFGTYPDDGECDCGIHKHHVHCGTCGKVSQIG